VRAGSYTVVCQCQCQCQCHSTGIYRIFWLKVLLNGNTAIITKH
jgi:hypothetical protein